MRLIVLICLCAWSGTLFSQTADSPLTLSELVAEIDAVRTRFDHCYFESYGEAQYDALAAQNGWRNSPSLEWQKIGRDGEKRYSHRKTKSAPDAKIKYANQLEISVWDGESCRILEHGELRIQKEKSQWVEANIVFYALGWPESENLKDPERVFIPRVFNEPEGRWEISSELLNDRKCYVVSSSVRKMRFWFDQQTKMPLKYEFQRSPYWPNNKTIEFLDYVVIDPDGTQFPQKIFTTADLYSPKGEFQGNATIQIDITNASRKPSADMFVLEGDR